MTRSLQLTKHVARSVVSNEAARLRARALENLETVYAEKEREALAFISAHQANPGSASAGPYIAAEAQATNRTPGAVALAIANAAAAWRTNYGAPLEAARLTGRAAINAATSPAAVRAAADDCIAAMRQIQA